MSSPKRNRARILTASGLKNLREQIRSHEAEENAGYKYTLERLGELTGLDSETVKNVLDCKGSDKRSIARCFESFGLTLEDSDHIPAVQASAALSDPNFVGRDEAIADLNALVSRNAKVIVIQARGGVGKTTLARKYLQQFGSFLEFPIAKETKDIASIESLIEEKLRQLGEEPGREFLVSIDRLKRKLQNDRIGILIDNLEPALDSAGKFIEAHRRYVELLRVLSDPIVKSITLITSRERLREADVTVQHYSLKNLDVQAWKQFFQSRSINTETPIAALHSAYGGNAKAMDIISGVVLEDFSGDVGAYWQANQDDLFVEQDLEDLVTKQFDRLQQLNPDAYKLLCRMGCYRYQDVPTIPIEGLFCLLWDVPDKLHRRVVRSLQDRSIIDSENGEFWLHPVVRSESMERLKIEEEEEITNYRIASFLAENTNIIQDIKDALKSLEIYYHYEKIKDFNMINYVVAKEMKNGWHNLHLNSLQLDQHLGSQFYTVGQPEYVESLIRKVLLNIRSNYSCSKVNHVLGDFYRLLGQYGQAIKSYEDSQKAAAIQLDALSSFQSVGINEIKIQMEWIEIASLLDMGLCKLDLWEIEESIHAFETTEALWRRSSYSNYFEPRNYYGQILYPNLALLNSLLKNKEKTIYFANKVYNASISGEIDLSNDGYVLNCLGKTFNYLEQHTISLEYYRMALLLSEKTSNPLLKAKTFLGLSDLCREQENFEQAIFYCLNSTALFNKNMGTTHNLAEAYYRLGLAYQSVNMVEESNLSFFTSTQLFTKISASKQVERVRQAAFCGA